MVTYAPRARPAAASLQDWRRSTAVRSRWSSFSSAVVHLPHREDQSYAPFRSDRGLTRIGLYDVPSYPAVQQVPPRTLALFGGFLATTPSNDERVLLPGSPTVENGLNRLPLIRLGEPSWAG
jgi:hypothetical protein